MVRRRRFLPEGQRPPLAVRVARGKGLLPRAAVSLRQGLAGVQGLAMNRRVRGSTHGHMPLRLFCSARVRRDHEASAGVVFCASIPASLRRLRSVSIWIMDENTFRGATGFHHRFRVRDDAGILELSSHLELHVLELDRWRHHPDLATPPKLRGWMRFFTEAETWREVPRDIDTPVLESAMSVLTDFQTNAARNDLYRSRLDYLRVQNTMADELAQALANEARALAREAQLRERLRAAGIDPDSE